MISGARGRVTNVRRRERRRVDPIRVIRVLLGLREFSGADHASCHARFVKKRRKPIPFAERGRHAREPSREVRDDEIFGGVARDQRDRMHGLALPDSIDTADPLPRRAGFHGGS